MDSAALMEGFHRCVASCNDAGDAQSQFVPWTVEGKVAGYLTQEMVQALSNYPDVFSVSSTSTLAISPFCTCGFAEDVRSICLCHWVPTEEMQYCRYVS